MTKVTLTEGLKVYYQGMYGEIHFVCDHYVTVCVRKFPEKVRDVCLIVYPDQYSWITLAKESTK